MQSVGTVVWVKMPVFHDENHRRGHDGLTRRSMRVRKCPVQEKRPMPWEEPFS